MSDPLIGRQINNFIVRGQLGQGGMASVYLAYQPSVNREVALKIISISSTPSERDEFRLRFAQEAQVIASLEHAHILPVYDYGIYENEIAYIAMRLLRGGTLSDLLVDEPLPLDRTAEIFSQIALGLSYAHRKGIIHRDLKPSNILFDDSGFAYLSDFGLAKMVENSLGLTKSDAIVGTPMYMSPEQLRGTPLDARSDIYSLGCVLYHMLVGHQPFADSATGIVSIIYQQLEKEPTPPREVNPNVPPAVEQVVLRALRKNRDERFPSAEEMAAALNQALGRDPRSRERLTEQAPLVSPRASGTSAFTSDDSLIQRVPSERTTIDAPSPIAALPTPRPSSGSRWLLPGVLVLVLVAAAVVFALSQQPPAAAPTPTIETTSVAAVASATQAQSTPSEASPTETPAPTLAPATPIRAAVPLASVGSGSGEIAFVSNRDGNEEIYLMNSDGSDQRRLTDNPRNDTELSWSPDGAQLLFSSYGEDGNIENYVMNADGSNRQAIATWYGWDPVWSPDGTKILFGAYGDLGGDIFVINADGTDMQALTSNDYDEGYPAWSPDGTQIVFAVRQNGQEDLYIMDANGGNLHSLTDDPESDLYPVWSPDGTQIAFQSDRGGNSQIYLINPDGSDLHPLSSEPGDGYEPSWSPDGTQIAFMSYRDGASAEIYVANADGTNIRRLTDNDAEDKSPIWRPNP